MVWSVMAEKSAVIKKGVKQLDEAEKLVSITALLKCNLLEVFSRLSAGDTHL